MGKTIQLKNHALDTLLYPITTSQAVMMSDGVTSVEDALGNINVTTDAQNISFNNDTNGMKSINVQDAIEENRSSFEDIQTNLSVTKNSSTYKTENGTKEFKCNRYGYVDNIFVEGNTIRQGSDGSVDENGKFISIGDNGIDFITRQYNSDKSEILREDICHTPVVLRSLSDTVKDSIIKKADKYYKLNMCGAMTIKSIDEFIFRTGVDYPDPNDDDWMEIYGFAESKDTINNFKPDGLRFLDKGKEMPYRALLKYFGMGFAILNNSKLLFKPFYNLADYLYEDYLPMTLIYELETPFLEELSNFNPRTFEGDTTFLIDGGEIQTEATFETTNSLGSDIDLLKMKVSSLEKLVGQETVNLINNYNKLIDDIL